MNKEFIAIGLSGVLLGFIGGWIIGSQQGSGGQAAPAAQQQAAPAPQQQSSAARPLDENRIAQLRSEADRDPRNAAPRAELGNLYFDSEHYDEAARWYAAALEIDPKQVDVSTDLGIAYYYTNQPDRALEQFDRSLAIDPKHSKTLLNIGVVKAFGKQDLEGATKAWERVLEVAPNSPEAARAKQGLDGIRSAHPTGTGRGGS